MNPCAHGEIHEDSEKELIVLDKVKKKIIQNLLFKRNKEKTNSAKTGRSYFGQQLLEFFFLSFLFSKD